MSNGANGTLKLNPHGGTAVTLQLGRTEPQGVETYVISVDLGSLRFGEADRIQWNYDEGRDGGRAVDQKGGMVPVVYTAIIKATTVAARVTGYNALLAAVTNRRGGTLEFAPEGLSSSTFYHYQPSAAPVLQERADNRWDRDAQNDGLYMMVADVELMTQPLATSDPNPDTPPSLIAAGQAGQTVMPGEGTYADIGLTDTLAIDALSGTEPVLTRILAFGAGGQDVGRVITFRKTGTGKDADHLIDSVSASLVGDTKYWSTVVDAARHGGSYLRIRPPADKSGTEYTHRYTLPDPAYWEGVFAVFVIGYDESGVSGEWTHKAVLRLGSKAVQESSEHYSRLYGNWQMVYVGELELPPTTLSLEEQDAGYGATCTIDIVSKRNSGASGFRFDAMVLVQVSDNEGSGAVLDVVCDQEDAITADDRLVIENRVGEHGQPLEVAHALTSGDLAFSRTLSVAPRGTFLTLDPEREHTVRFVHERALAEPFVENLEDYDGRYFQQLGHFWAPELYAPFTSYEGWALTSDSYYSSFQLVQSESLEGWYYGKILATTNAANAGYGRIERNLALDYSSETAIFTDDDMFCFSRWWDHIVAQVDRARVGFIDRDGVMAYTTIQLLTSGYLGQCVRRSDLSSADVFNWGNIQKVFVDYGVKAGAGNLNSELWIDHIRVEKRNYDNLSEPDVTGGKWTFGANEGRYWTLTTDTARAAFTFWPVGYRSIGGWRRDLGTTLACMAYDEVYHGAMLDEEAPEYFQFSVRLTNHHQFGGNVGIFWCDDGSFPTGIANWNGYVLLVTNSPMGNSMVLLKYTAGAWGYAGDMGSGTVERSVPSHYREPVFIGVRLDRSTGVAQVYMAPEGETACDDDLWLVANLAYSFTDTDFMSNTKVGLISQGDCLRADKIILRDANDRINATDALRVAVQGQYRTITPLV